MVLLKQIIPKAIRFKFKKCIVALLVIHVDILLEKNNNYHEHTHMV